MRRKYLDNIRLITVLLVVLYHVFYVYNNCGVLGGIGPLGAVQYGDVLLYILYPWFMLLLFVVSGMSARYCLEKYTHKEFIRAKTAKLLIPSTVGLFVFWWILGYFNIKYSGGLEFMKEVPLPIFYIICSVSGVGPLWYIQLLWLYSVLLIPIRKAEKDRLYNLCGRVGLPVLLLLFFAVWGAAQILNTPVVEVYRFGIYGLGYCIGYFCLSHDEVTDRLESACLPLSAASVLLCAAFVWVYWGQNYTDKAVLQSPLCNAYAWVSVLAIMGFMKKFADSETAFSAYWNKKSWGLYLFHYLPLIVCAGYLYDKPVPNAVRYLLCAVSAYGGAVILYEIIRRIPLLRYVVCGIKKKK